VTTPRLPIRELPLAGESLTGLLRRYVTAMHYDGLQQLLNLVEDIDFPMSLDGLPPGEALRALAVLIGRDVDDLRPLTLHRWAERLVLRPLRAATPEICDLKTIVRYFRMTQSRVCAVCLAENPELERLVWRFRPLGICAEHQSILRDHCPGCRRRFLPTRLDLAHCRCGYRLCDALPHRVTGRAFELSRQIAAWLEGARFQSFDLPAQAGFWWLDRLRIALSSAPAWLDVKRREWSLPQDLDPESTAWLAAAELVIDPAALTGFLDLYQTIEKRRTAATGVGRSFGWLLRDAANLEQLSFSVPADRLRDYLLEHFDQGHLTGKVILFRSLRDRRRLAERCWLDQTTAARMLGMRTPSVKRLVHRGALVGRIAETGTNGRTSGVVSRDSVEQLRRKLARHLSLVEAGSRLGIERHRVSDLIRTGILREAVRTTGGWRVSQAAVEDLLNEIRQVPPLSQSRAGWITLHEATRRFGGNGLNLAGILKQVLSGRLAARRDPRVDTLRGVYLELISLRSAANEARLTSETQSGYPLNRLARLLVPGRPLKETVLKKWIAVGLLAAQRRRKAWSVTAAEVERFRATYCLAPEACTLLNVRRSTLARWEVQRQIVSVYGRRTHPGAGASVFLRSDVCRLAARDAD